MSQPPHSPSRLEQDSAPASIGRGTRWRAAAKALGVGERRSATGGARTGTAGSPSRRLVDLLSVEPGYRIAFLDDPGGLGGRLAGDVLSRQRSVFLYGLNVGAGVMPSYADGCFDLIVAAGESKHWPLVSRTLGQVARLVRPDGIVAVISSHATSVVGRGMLRLAKPGSVGADPHDAHDVAVGRRLVEIFGSASRTEQGFRVVWQATREVSG